MRDDTESAPADAIVLVKPRGDALPASARPSIPPVLVWLVVPAYFLLADAFLVPGMCIWSQNDWGAVVVYITMGIVLSQFAVIPAALAWSTAEFWRRLAVAAAMTLGGGTAWLYGLAVGSVIDGHRFGQYLERASAAALFMLPAIVLAIAIPLLVLRVLSGWRITRSPEGDSGERPLSIADLLSAMAIVAAALASSRMAKELATGVSESEFWLGLASGAAGGAGAAVVIVAPLAWLTFRARSLSLVIVSVGIYAAVVYATLWIVLSWMFGRMNLWESIGVSISALVFVIVTTVVLRLARAAGYRLEFGARAAR